MRATPLRPAVSRPIHTYLGGQVEVVSRKKSKHQLAPEIGLRHIGVEVMSMSPESARELAESLLDAAEQVEQSNSRKSTS